MKKIEDLKERKDLQISHIYMVGDNPDADILSAKKMGWVSILVKTGVFKGEEEDLQKLKYIPDYLVYDFEEAINLIL
jgi:ribonucleotide monophosphatase NagD (HAD superfamily)